MEIEYKKYDLTELRESSREYIRILDTIEWDFTTTAIAQLGSEQHPINDEANIAVARLHNAMCAIDRNAVIEVLSKYDDFSTNDPTSWINSAKTALEDLRKTIRDKKYIAKRIDQKLESVRTYCKEMADWLGQQLAIIVERKRAFYATPTAQEKIWLEDLIVWNIEDWLDEYIFVKDISIIYKKRLLALALKTDGIDEKKLKRLNEVLSQVNGQIERQQIITCQTFATKSTEKCKKSFSDIIQYPNKEKLLTRLHFLIDGKSGSDVGAVLLRAQVDGLLTRCPTKSEFISEFDLIGTWQAIHNYMNVDNNNAFDKANKIRIFQDR